MRKSIPIVHIVTDTWKTDVREIAETLGIPLTPNQYVTLQFRDDHPPLTGVVYISVIERSGEEIS